MSRLEKRSAKIYSIDSKCKLFLSDPLKVTGSTITAPKSYDEQPCQVKYRSPPRGGSNITCNIGYLTISPEIKVKEQQAVEFVSNREIDGYRLFSFECACTGVVYRSHYSRDFHFPLRIKAKIPEYAPILTFSNYA